eukprot:TRINITY_DN2297_c0_g2_i5.p1 TRINITY_DN2297_c0_g2~~TRINITY_DN2297_c0_g2_i5.p1  ORF type:complete len:182 (+),score=41.70 TRINITY_DN2297_c0_g2_i5:45-590(+)
MALYEKAWELYESEFRQLHAETSDLLQILVDDYEKQLYDIREANEEDKKNDERLKSIRRDCMLKMVKLRELASHLQDVVKVQPASLQVYAGALASSCEMELQRMQVIYDRVNNKIRDTLVDTVYYAEKLFAAHDYKTDEVQREKVSKLTDETEVLVSNPLIEITTNSPIICQPPSNFESNL